MYGSISPKSLGPGNIVEKDGNCIYVLEGLENGKRYFFKIASYDSNYNESKPSNVLSCVPYDNKSYLIENKYCVDGNLFTGIFLNIGNIHNGYLPSGFTHYDEINYDEGTYESTAVYESPLIDSNTIHLIGVCDIASDILVCYRTYDNGSFGSWTTPQSAMGYTSITPNMMCQLRVIFNSPHWSDEDMIYIEAIE